MQALPGTKARAKARTTAKSKSYNLTPAQRKKANERDYAASLHPASIAADDVGTSERYRKARDSAYDNANKSMKKLKSKPKPMAKQKNTPKKAKPRRQGPKP